MLLSFSLEQTAIWVEQTVHTIDFLENDILSKNKCLFQNLQCFLCLEQTQNVNSFIVQKSWHTFKIIQLSNYPFIQLTLYTSQAAITQLNYSSFF